MINVIHVMRRKLSGLKYLKYLYVRILAFIPIHTSYELNRKLRSPYSELEIANNIIFIHIPKAAGNALIKSLYGCTATGHDPLRRYLAYDKERFEKSFKFSVVRNPWDRMVSSFHYLKQGGIGFFDVDFRDRYLSECDDFSQFITKMMSDSAFEKKIMSWVHFVPQIDFLSLSGENIDVDLWVRLEEMPQEFDLICERLGVEPKKMLKDNASHREGYKTYYTDLTAKYVEGLYQLDVDMLGYKFR